MSEREPRTDDCPHCKQSMWMGLHNPEGCQCLLPSPITVTSQYYGAPVEAEVRDQHGGQLLFGYEAEIKSTLARRVELFHFVRGLRFHLRHAEENLRVFDEQLGDRTCCKCGFVECSCPRSPP